MFETEGPDKMAFTFYHNGKRSKECDKAPVTCALIGGFREASSCLRGKVSFFPFLVLHWERQILDTAGSIEKERKKEGEGGRKRESERERTSERTSKRTREREQERERERTKKKE